MRIRLLIFVVALTMLVSVVLTAILADRQAERQNSEAAVHNKAAGEAFLAANAEREGVVTTASGLQYRVITPGEGEPPALNDSIRVNYEGRLVDGTTFDSSEKAGQPGEFPLRLAVPGWIEALQLMRPGAVWEVCIPPELAYGDRRTSPVGPNQTLIFKIELLDVL